MNGISKLRVSGAERRAFSVWAHFFSQQKKLHLRTRTLALWLSVLRSVYPLISVSILFSVADPLRAAHMGKTLSTGSFLAFFAAYIQFLSSSVQFTSVFPSLIGVIPVFERLLPILETVPEVEEGRSSPGELRGSIEVNHLSFRYDPASSPILRDISFHVRPGEFVAFTGPSGSGKSTLLRLLLGFETAEGGNVSFDDQDIAGIDVQALRRQIGVVLQSGRLVSGSILDNIIGSLPLSHDEAWEAARMAGLEKDIKAMPMGMYTFINDGGAGLSGGQRQRLMIARAIVSKPRILFFDEATSALDNHTQAIVSRSLEALQATRVVIAHRLSTIQQADRIYVLDKGMIVQVGNFETLSTTPGLFQTLVQRQVL
jgi:ABC-type bacteriocin/lantibiotic exporter with double-glycine peptidase domain